VEKLVFFWLNQPKHVAFEWRESLIRQVVNHSHFSQYHLEWKPKNEPSIKKYQEESVTREHRLNREVVLCVTCREQLGQGSTESCKCPTADLHSFLELDAEVLEDAEALVQLEGLRVFAEEVDESAALRPQIQPASLQVLQRLRRILRHRAHAFYNFYECHYLHEMSSGLEPTSCICVSVKYVTCRKGSSCCRSSSSPWTFTSRVLIRTYREENSTSMFSTEILRGNMTAGGDTHTHTHTHTSGKCSRRPFDTDSVWQAVIGLKGEDMTTVRKTFTYPERGREGGREGGRDGTLWC